MIILTNKRIGTENYCNLTQIHCSMGMAAMIIPKHEVEEVEVGVKDEGASNSNISVKMAEAEAEVPRVALVRGVGVDMMGIVS